MSPDKAKLLKNGAKLLLVCRMSSPWFRHTAHGHKPTIDDPYETTVGDNYLQVMPVGLLVFNQNTGQIIEKLTNTSVTANSENQLQIRLRATPVLLEVSGTGVTSMKVSVDDDTPKSVMLTTETKTFGAKKKIVLTLEYPHSLSGISLKLNGKPYMPDWTKDSSVFRKL